MIEESKIIIGTVAELIDELQKMPQDVPVLVSGYESDMTAARGPVLGTAIRLENVAWYYGDWVEADEDNDGKPAVYIAGERHG